MTEISVGSIADAGREVGSILLRDGVDTPRHIGEWTMKKDQIMVMREIEGFHLIVEHPMRRWYNLVSTGLVQEYLDIITGGHGFIDRVWKFYRKWKDRGDNYPYEYGTRIFGTDETINQWSQAVRILRDDPTSRQAYIVIRRPQDLTETYTPCSVGFHFISDSQKFLNVHWYIRSNDVTVGGLMRNLFIASHLLEQMSLSVGLLPGKIFHYADNIHIYSDDIEKIRKMIQNVCELPEQSLCQTFLTNSDKSYIREVLETHFYYHQTSVALGLLPSVEDFYHRAMVRYIIAPEIRNEVPEILWLQENKVE